MTYPEFWQQDLGASTQNILLEAVHLDLGAVWLGIAPIENEMKYVSDVLNLEDKLLVYAMVAVGYPDREPKSVDRYDDSRLTFIK